MGAGRLRDMARKRFYQKAKFKRRVQAIKAGYGKGMDFLTATVPTKVDEYNVRINKAAKKVKKDFQESMDFDISFD